MVFPHIPRRKHSLTLETLNTLAAETASLVPYSRPPHSRRSLTRFFFSTHPSPLTVHHDQNFLNMVIEGLKKMWDSFKKILVMLKKLIIHVVTRLYIGLGLRADVLPVPSIGTICCTRLPDPEPTRPDPDTPQQRNSATAHSHTRPPPHAGKC